MEHIEDISPAEYRFVSIPHETHDALIRRNVLSIGVLSSWLRHADSYGWTLTKLIKIAGGQGKSQLSQAYNALIEDGYIGRVEYTYARPDGSTGRSGQRATYGFVSRVPISEDRVIAIIERYTPGQYVMAPVKADAVDEAGRPVYELRRVKVLAAEIYCARGALRIEADGATSEHINRRGGRSKQAAPRRPPGRAGDDVEGAAPEVEISTSGATSDDALFPQVAPEVGLPESGASTSIKNINGEDQVEDQKDGGAPPLAPGEGPPKSGRSYEHRGHPAQVVDDQLELVGDHQKDTAEPAETDISRPSCEACGAWLDPDGSCFVCRAPIASRGRTRAGRGQWTRETG